MAGHAASVYVQIDIRGSIDRVWELTQTPELHEQWDIRFTEIKYLPRPDSSLPQRFLYVTRLGFGIQIRGEGESVGSRDGEAGDRTSALKFWSLDPKSLISEGAGYWRYIPGGGGQDTTRFLTRYDYAVRFGWAGRVFDRLVFRPLIGWATAWSFDRLRLWIEVGTPPAAAMRQSLVYTSARLSLALVFIYQGVVPKLVLRHPDELAMLRAAGFSESAANRLGIALGWAEVSIGMILVFAWRSRWPLWLIMGAMPAAVMGLAVQSPELLGGPFNPVSLNLSVFGLALIAALSRAGLPSARRCVRRSPGAEA
jgi:uncharacterized membrane protein YphA (DoxX/SURF4 family)